MNARPDAELVAEARRGSRPAMAELVARYHRQCVGLGWRFLGDADAATDAAQEAFVRALEGLHGLKRPDRFWPWLARIVVNACRSIRRREGAGPKTEPLLDAPAAPAPDPDAPRRRKTVADAVQRLIRTQREAVVLFYYHGFSLEDAAQALGCSANAVKARLFAARRRLARELEGLV